MPLFGRVAARLHGEIPADDLDGLRRAGATVFDLVADVDRQRVDQQLAGHTAWTTDAAAQTAALCAWNAFVLQTLGDALLDVHDEHGTPGFASEQTHGQALAYYRSVQDWVRRGREAESGGGDVAVDVPLPAALPGPAGAWRQPYPAEHIEALRRALDVVGTRAEAAARDLLAAPDAAQHADDAAVVRRLLAAAATAADYATQSSSARLVDSTQTAAGRQLHAALDNWSVLGQLVAMPRLIAGVRA